jgi:hypothetical protein
MKAELRDVAWGLGGRRRRLAPTVPRRLRAAEQSGGGACAWTKARWGRPCSSLSRVEIRPGPRGVVETNGVRSPSHHRMRSRARAVANKWAPALF